MMLPTRRGLLLGLSVSLIMPAPSVVRASSLMPLCGILLDPLVIAYTGGFSSKEGRLFTESIYNYVTGIVSNQVPLAEKAKILNSRSPWPYHFRVMRRSECDFLVFPRFDQSTK